MDRNTARTAALLWFWAFLAFPGCSAVWLRAFAANRVFELSQHCLSPEPVETHCERGRCPPPSLGAKPKRPKWGGEPPLAPEAPACNRTEFGSDPPPRAHAKIRRSMSRGSGAWNVSSKCFMGIRRPPCGVMACAILPLMADGWCLWLPPPIDCPLNPPRWGPKTVRRGRPGRGSAGRV